MPKIVDEYEDQAEAKSGDEELISKLQFSSEEYDFRTLEPFDMATAQTVAFDGRTFSVIREGNCSRDLGDYVVFNNFHAERVDGLDGDPVSSLIARRQAVLRPVRVVT